MPQYAGGIRGGSLLLVPLDGLELQADEDPHADSEHAEEESLSGFRYALENKEENGDHAVRRESAECCSIFLHTLLADETQVIRINEVRCGPHQRPEYRCIG